MIPLLGAALSIVIFTLYNGISPMPSSKRARQAMIEMLNESSSFSQVKIIHELGSGWGHLSIDLARAFPEKHIVGIENSWIPYLVSKIRAFYVRPPNLSILYKNFWSLHFSEIECLVTYQYRNGMQQIYSKWLKEGRGPLLCVSHVFAIDHLRAANSKQVDDLFSSTVYLYDLFL
ncbi:MAG: hypothetical protein K9M07_00380 [Simkaniaceae bacterium]|nr:hypothetical protein [Simkaniaceae bacterium]